MKDKKNVKPAKGEIGEDPVNNEKGKRTIKEWAADDRPREKMIAKGKASLSDAELIAILIGSGNSEKSAVELAREILEKSKDNLIELSRLSIEDLMRHKGIGEAKAISIIAALELGNRRRHSEAVIRSRIGSSKDAFEYLCTCIEDFNHENFLVLQLNQGNKVISHSIISHGGLTGTVADPKVIFKSALMNNASGIILCHNHPSGETNPSKEDIMITKKIVMAGKSLDIRVLDHIIIGAENFFSFADNGMIE